MEGPVVLNFYIGAMPRSHAHKTEMSQYNVCTKYIMGLSPASSFVFLLCNIWQKKCRRLIDQELAAGLEPFRWKLPLKYFNMLMLHFRGIFTPTLFCSGFRTFQFDLNQNDRCKNLPQITVQTQLLNFGLTKRGSLSSDQTDSWFQFVF